MPRLSVNINDATAEALREIAADKGVSMTEALRLLSGYGAALYRADKEGFAVFFQRGFRTDRIVLVED